MSRAQLTSTVEQNGGGSLSSFIAGKNFLANGAMDIFQRSTSATFSSGGYFAPDRWVAIAGTSQTFSQESTIVPSGFRYSLKMLANATATLGQLQTQQVIETANAIYLAGQTVTFSAYIYGSSSTSIGIGIQYNTSVDATWNGGGWSSISATSGGTGTATTSWSKITGTYTIPSNAKTVLVQIYNNATVSSSAAIYFTGLQLELGSVATPFSRAGGTVQGELALCQRYLPVIDGTYSSYNPSDSYIGYAYGTNTVIFTIPFAVPARTNPTGLTVIGSGFVGYGLNTAYGITPQFDTAGTNYACIVSGSGITITAGQGSRIGIPNTGKLLFTGCEL